jgi:hypothetical protein
MSVSEEAPKCSTEGRDANGQFAKNNKGGPGNPFARQVTELRSRLLQRLKPEDIDAIADRLIELAKGGEVAATKLLFQYTLGKPVEQPHPDRIDRDEQESFLANSMNTSTPLALTEHTPLQPALKVMRVMQDNRADLFLKDLLAGMKAQDEKDEAKKRKQSVNKRPSPAQPATGSVPADVAFAETETIRLINRPDPAQATPLQQAANDRRS